MRACYVHGQCVHKGHDVVQQWAVVSRASRWQYGQIVTSPDVFVQPLYCICQLSVLCLEESYPSNDMSRKQQLMNCSGERLRGCSTPLVARFLAVVTESIVDLASVTYTPPITLY